MGFGLTLSDFCQGFEHFPQVLDVLMNPEPVRVVSLG